MSLKHHFIWSILPAVLIIWLGTANDWPTSAYIVAFAFNFVGYVEGLVVAGKRR